MHAIVRFVILVAIVSLGASLWLREALPEAKSIREELLLEPDQRATSRAAFDATAGGVSYRIEPRFNYDLYGLVVSRHDSAAWWDYVHKEWNDNLNVVDLCVVWGENIKRDAYRAIDYSHDQWTCWAQTGSSEAWAAFDMTAIANNHLITDDPRLAKTLRGARTGDQVHVRGLLADYTTFKDNSPIGKRVSSITRTDTGNGACEIVYVEDFSILQAGGGPWRKLFWVAVAMLVGGVIGWFLLPVRFTD